MEKILLIIKREYLSRVKKKSFIVMTILGPLLFAGVYGIIGYFSVNGTDTSVKKIAVVNENKSITKRLENTKSIEYNYVDVPLAALKTKMKESAYDYILYIPDFNIDHPDGIQLIAQKQPGITFVAGIESKLESAIREAKLQRSGLSQEELNKLKTSVTIDTKKLSEAGKEESSSAGASSGVGFAGGILMFTFIMLYGVQVMRGVIEEKTNRIIEVIISSVKPFQLMMGKIIGVAMVGLTQFILWIVLTFLISGFALNALTGNKETIQKAVKAQTEQTQGADGHVKIQTVKTADNPAMAIKAALGTLNYGYIIFVFLFYFLGGYLFYSALYAAIGSAVDSETETQQFMMPVMLPLLLSYALSLSVVINNPDGPLAFWLSMIPFTSPVAMMVRAPFDVPMWQMALSMGLLVVGFIGTVWIAARIYRVGILMYGKKTNFKEMAKWFMYKE